MTVSSSKATSRQRASVRRLALPDLMGLHVKNAKIVLQNAGFHRIKVHYVEDYAPEWTVVSQLPLPGPLVPSEAEIEIRISRQNLVQFLPQIYQQSDLGQDGQFVRGFLNIVRTIYDSVDARINDVARVFDPRTTDPEFLPWLSSWLAIGLNSDWSTLEQRKMLMAAAKLFPIRGTARAIQEFVHIYVGAEVEIEENAWPFKGFRVGVHSTVGEDTVILPPMNLAHCFVVRLAKTARATSDDEIVKIHQIIQQQKPAHTSYFLAFADEEESREMGVFMAIGGAIGVDGPSGAEALDESPMMPMGIGIGIGGEVLPSSGESGILVDDEGSGGESADMREAKKAEKKPMITVGKDASVEGRESKGKKTAQQKTKASSAAGQAKKSSKSSQVGKTSKTTTDKKK